MPTVGLEDQGGPGGGGWRGRVGVRKGKHLSEFRFDVPVDAVEGNEA